VFIAGDWWRLRLSAAARLAMPRTRSCRRRFWILHGRAGSSRRLGDTPPWTCAGGVPRANHRRRRERAAARISWRSNPTAQPWNGRFNHL
jgi:hypothetical protein